jgi:hypothetical protein
MVPSLHVIFLRSCEHIVISRTQLKNLLCCLSLLVQNLREFETFRHKIPPCTSIGMASVASINKSNPRIEVFFLHFDHCSRSFFSSVLSQKAELYKAKQISVSLVQLPTLDSPSSLTELQCAYLGFQRRYPNTSQGRRTVHRLIVSLESYLTNRLCLPNN